MALPLQQLSHLACVIVVIFFTDTNPVMSLHGVVWGKDMRLLFRLYQENLLIQEICN